MSIIEFVRDGKILDPPEVNGVPIQRRNVFMDEKEKGRIGGPSSHFEIKESGVRVKFDSGMVRDVGVFKARFFRCLAGPMLRRWAEHLHKGQEKYPDVSPGVANWTLAQGEEELQRFKESALDHMIDWLEGKEDEDHGAAVFFNINGAEYVKEGIRDGKSIKTAAQEGQTPKGG
ncbi:hypothetical protein LCGC14_2528660 [marine sediment metagenome]|uniref:Uncharacterized protein n=1 Tax=marine sediment metagenome TaxID=412755 RepID=A0A0F9AUN1_9ZZZZ